MPWLSLIRARTKALYDRRALHVKCEFTCVILVLSLSLSRLTYEIGEYIEIRMIFSHSTDVTRSEVDI